jgi:hypothetical protein
MGVHGVGRIFERIIAAAGMEGKNITPHCMRHAFALRGIENGADIKTLQQQMRHSHVVTTMKYLVTNRPITDDKAAAFGRGSRPAPPPVVPDPPPVAAPALTVQVPERAPTVPLVVQSNPKPVVVSGRVRPVRSMRRAA